MTHIAWPVNKLSFEWIYIASSFTCIATHHSAYGEFIQVILIISLIIKTQRTVKRLIKYKIPKIWNSKNRISSTYHHKKSFILAKYYTYILSTVLTKRLSNTANQSTLPRLPRERQSSILIPIVIQYSSNSSRVILGIYWYPHSF